MRSSFFGAMAVIVLAGCTCSESPPSPNSSAKKPESPLAAYVNLDLRKLEEDRKPDLNKLLTAILPEKQRRERLWAPESWSIWKNESTKEKNGFILFQGCHIFEIPGQSYATVHFLDGSGKLVNTVEFSTGWRIDIDSAIMQDDPGLKGYCIDVRSSPAIGGRDVRRQVYGIIGGRLALLWLEDSEKKMISNTYYAPNHTIGPEVPKRTAQEWEQALSSPRRMVVLETLAWLGGEHRRDLSATPENVSMEDIESARLVAAVRQRPAVRKTLKELCSSEVEPVQQAAKLALEEVAK